jgi:hypothetical protein
MAHFAQINSENEVVNILTVPDNQEHRGEEYLNEIGFEGRWIQTSYNTFGNQHNFGGTPLRANYALIGGLYDPEYDVFYVKQPKPYMVLNMDTFQWEYPVPIPTDIPLDSAAIWNESIMDWEVMDKETFRLRYNL